jgi:hypothetical protein
LVIIACAAIAFLAVFAFDAALNGWGFLFAGLDVALATLWAAAVMQRRRRPVPSRDRPAEGIED